jgi:hypothetical protein
VACNRRMVPGSRGRGVADRRVAVAVLRVVEAVALAWCDAHPWSVDGVRSNTYLVGEWTPERGEDEIPGVVQVNQRDHPILTERLYPICEHGMSAQLCAGPMHYPTDAQLMGGAW